jgi:hypothetical protein
LQFRDGIASGGIDVVGGPEFSREGFFVFASADGESAEAHLSGVLDSQMAESADALHGYQIACARNRVAERVENCDAGTKQRRGLGGGEIVWNCGDRFGGCNHVFLVTSVVTDSGDFFLLAVNEVTAATGITSEIMTSVPSNADPLARFPVGYVGAHGIDAAGDFVSGNAWILEAGPMAFLYERIAVADATGFDFDPDLVARGFGNVSFDEFKITTGLADLDGFHF